MDTSKPRILYVEDDLMAKTLVVKYLNNRYEIHCASNTREAVNKAIENNYDAFLIDIGLPASNGMETSKQLKEIKNNINKPYIAVTAYAMPEYKEYFLSEGLTHYISKPYEPKDLIKLIDKALGRDTES